MDTKLKDLIINNIKNIIKTYGAFSIGEVDGADSICVNEMGKFVGLAEYFNSTTIEVKVYEPESFSSDEIDSYELTYDELTIEVLKEILFVADLYETDQEKTLKRIS
jgi:hypothetical protein